MRTKERERKKKKRTRIDALFARLNRQHPLSSNLSRHLDRLVDDRALLDDARDESPLARLLGRKVAAGEDEFHRARFPDRVRQALSTARARDHAQLQKPHTKSLSATGCHAQIACRNKTARATCVDFGLAKDGGWRREDDVAPVLRKYLESQLAISHTKESKEHLYAHHSQFATSSELCGRGARGTKEGECRTEERVPPQERKEGRD